MSQVKLLGRIAQLAERLFCEQRVLGSTPSVAFVVPQSVTGSVATGIGLLCRNKRGFVVCLVAILALSVTSTSTAQQPAYAIAWTPPQPVAVPGQVIAVPRPLYVTNWLWGPRLYFVPQAPIPQQPLGPVR